jgi:hypothetical protein
VVRKVYSQIYHLADIVLRGRQVAVEGIISMIQKAVEKRELANPEN